MVRTLDASVRLTTDVDTTDDLTGHIAAASLMVDKVLVTDHASGYADELLELIERYLAAHFYRILKPQVTSESLGGLSESVSVSLGQQLKQTTPGQQVLILDVDGYFAKLQGNAETGRQTRRLGLSWLGTTTAE